MEDAELIEQIRAVELPGGLSEQVDAFIDAAAALLPVYPAEFRYQAEFGHRTLLRELLDPDKWDNHWWESGLHFIRQGIANQPAQNI